MTQIQSPNFTLGYLKIFEKKWMLFWFAQSRKGKVPNSRQMLVTAP